MTGLATIDMPTPRDMLAARRRRPPEAFTSADKTAFGFFRLRVPRRELQRLPWPRLGPIDLRQVVAPELTGDLAVISSGSHPLGLHFIAGLRNPGPVKLTLRSTCRLASFAGYGSFRFRNGQCQGKVNLRKLGAPKALLTWLPAKVPVFVKVTSSGASLSIMTPMRPGLPVGAAQGPVAARLHGVDWNLSTWGRWSDPEVLLTGRRAAIFRGRLAELGMPRVVTAARALLAHVYDGGLGVRATDTGLVIEGSLSSFRSDPPEVYRQYSNAAIALAGGDVPKYLRTISALAKKYPNSLIARQAAVRGTPIAPLAGVSALFERYWHRLVR